VPCPADLVDHQGLAYRKRPKELRPVEAQLGPHLNVSVREAAEDELIASVVNYGPPDVCRQLGGIDHVEALAPPLPQGEL